MYLKNALISLLLLISSSVFGQIKIDDVGDGWKSKVDSALSLIEKTSPSHYKEVIENCNYVTFWIGNFSTTQDTSTVVISVKDMKLGSVNNIACILIHESHHLYFKRNKIKLDVNKEELLCYQYEYEFLQKIPNAENWLTIHVIKSILRYKGDL